MPGLIGYPSMWLHQQQVFEAVKAGQHVLVATGTGSGKTESFLYPIIDDLLRQRDKGVHEGLTAILVYPMNALANDQLDRLRDMLGGTGITFGQWVGTTPSDRGRGRHRPVPRLGACRLPRRPPATAGRSPGRGPGRASPGTARGVLLRGGHPRAEAPHPADQLPPVGDPDHPLPDVALFAQAPLKYLVFDEAHTYGGATGAEVACLIRRVRALAGKTPDEIICIGTSATLSDPTKKDEDNEETARRFASRFFGVDPTKVRLVGESYVSREWPRQRYRPIAPHGDGMARLSRVLAAVTEPVDLAAIKGVVEELTGQIFDPGDDWRESLFDHLVDERVRLPDHADPQAPQAAERGGVADLAADRHESAAGGRPGQRRTAGLSDPGCRRPEGGESLLRPKVHFFLRGLDEMVVALDGTEADPKLQLFLSLHDAKEQYPGRHDDAFFPVLTCRSCGQHFFEKYYQDLEFARGPRTSFGASRTARRHRTTTGRTTPSGPRHPREPAPGWC